MQIKSEMSRITDLTRLPQKGMILEISAQKDELAQIAKRFSLLEISDLSARVTLSGQKSVRVKGSFAATVTQRCVVTLEPVVEKVTGTFDEVYTSEIQTLRPEELIEIDMEAEERLPMGDGKVDIGELVLEHFALALNPYPKKAGLHTDFFYKDEAPEDELAENPFAKLAELKKKTIS